MGEVGAAMSPDCMASVKYLLDFMETNSDVWLGANWWSGENYSTNKQSYWLVDACIAFLSSTYYMRCKVVSCFIATIHAEFWYRI